MFKRENWRDSWRFKSMFTDPIYPQTISSKLKIVMTVQKPPNNLDFLRLIGALLVLVGHSFPMLGLTTPLFLSFLPISSLGIYIFFIISGYFIAQSWDKDPNILRFFVRRILRIFPGLAVSVMFCILVLGPSLTTLPISEYFSHIQTRNYLNNIALYITYPLPGVFTNNIIPHAVNGSIWSLPVEFAMYMGVAYIGFLQCNRWAVATLAIFSAMLTYFWVWRAQTMLVIYATDLRQIFLCGTFFWVGAIFYKFNLNKYLSLRLAGFAILVLFLLQPHHQVIQVAAWVLFPIIVLSFGFAHSPLLSRLTNTGDYSYGIYIYAFPIQQTIAYLYPGISIRLYVIICTGIALVFGMASWHFVEKIALSFKPKHLKSNI
jgi:peptidoglycan/LPS O-acetylase OafA/YrhL